MSRVAASTSSTVLSCTLPHLRGVPKGEDTLPANERAFRERVGCKPHYNGPVFAPETTHIRCGRCGQNVDPISRVLIGQTPYHPRCLFCFKCNEQSAEIYLDYNGHPVCLRCSRQIPDFQRRTSTKLIDSGKCKKCMKSLEGKIVTAMGFRWHSTCFRCGLCGRDFEADGAFGEKDGKPYHVSCARRLSRSLPMIGVTPCAGCGSLIHGDYISTSSGAIYHKHCMKCITCGAQITGSRFGEDAASGRPQCLRCSIKRIT